jgi:hypothetical protein
VNSRRQGNFFLAPVAATVGVLLLIGLPAGASAGGYPPLPLADDRGFVGNLSAPTLAPGGSGVISFSVGNPLAVPVTNAELILQVYAFNGFPGNATAIVAVAGAPVLSNASSSGASVGLSFGTLSSHQVVLGSVSVATSATTPSGAFAVRTHLTFSANSTPYLLESRGWFNASLWAAATELPNGTATLNLSVLGVSGVLPESAVVVAESNVPWILTGVLVGAAVFAGAGAWVYFRRGPGSNSGARSADVDHHAPSALGKRRTNDGD